MLMVGKTPRARKNDRQRMDTIAKHCGCLPCLLLGHMNSLTTIEHVTDRGRRIGGDEQHQWTIGLCKWHHFGHTNNHWTRQQMSGEFGPPLAWGRRDFEDHFGDEVLVLVPVQNFLLGLFAERPWPEYNLPRNVARKVRLRWIDLNHASVTSQSSTGSG